MSNQEKSTISVRISQAEKEKLQEFAKKSDLTISYLVRKLIKEYLANN